MYKIDIYINTFKYHFCLTNSNIFVVYYRLKPCCATVPKHMLVCRG